MAKKYISFVIIAVLLVGCGTSPKASPTATNIPTAIPTNTSTPTATPTNTLTPTATNSPTPTMAPTPSVPLRKVLITISDLAVFSDFYYENPIINDKSDVSPIILDSCEETFLEKTPAIGTVTMNLIRYKIPSDAQKINDGMKLAVTVFNVTFTKTTVPDNFWVGKTLTNDVWASATYHDVLIYLKLEKIPSGKPEDKAGVALLLIKNQVIRLEDGGY